ncbi:rhomboid family intramembrane serine protease [Flavobacterium sp.]|uniref:rhomboid family intramembrane serine protease n=1 Tax=Flavobacterium sp. TaxID=239 RepID=UPI004047E859
MIKMTDMVKHLLIINIIFFVVSIVLPSSNSLLAMHYFESPNFYFWQPLTRMFMHFGLGHIFFNMFTLIIFGSALEQMWGGKKFLFFYLSCGFGAVLLSSAINYFEFHHSLNILVENGFDKNEIYKTLNEMKYNVSWEDFLSPRNFSGLISNYNSLSAGASGAISGLFIAFAFTYPNRELSLLFIPIPIKAKYFVMGIFSMDLFFGLQGSSIIGNGQGTGIGHFAHLGGALVGFLMMWFWKKNQFDKNRWDRR